MWVCNLDSDIKGRIQIGGVRERVLRNVSGPKAVEVKGDWRKQHKEELLDWYSSPNVTGEIKSGRMRRTGKVHSYNFVCVCGGGGGNKKQKKNTSGAVSHVCGSTLPWFCLIY
jgi:hypothetical protein